MSASATSAASSAATSDSLYVTILNELTRKKHNVPRDIAYKFQAWQAQLDHWSTDKDSLTFYGSQELLIAVLEVAEFGSTTFTNNIILSKKLQELLFVDPKVAPITYRCFIRASDASRYLPTKLVGDSWITRDMVSIPRMDYLFHIKIRGYITYSYSSGNEIKTYEYRYKPQSKTFNYGLKSDEFKIPERPWHPESAYRFKLKIDVNTPHVTTCFVY